MADNDPLADVFNLFAAPLAGTVRSFEQFRKGVDEFLKGVENFNKTMENLNETAERINGVLAEIEEPIKAAVPQLTRSIKAADDVMKVVSGPAIAVAPGLERLSETLGNPAFHQFPNQLAQMAEMMNEISTRLSPLGQLAESAGGLFGGFKLPGFGGGTSPNQPAPVAVDEEPPPPPPTRSTPARRTAAKKPATKKRAAKKSTAKKKSAARKK